MNAALASVLVVALALGMSGCGGPLASVLGLPRVVDREPQPGDRRVSIDAVEMSQDKLTAVISFTGGPPFDPNDPCSTDYVAIGNHRDDVLEVAVIETVTSGEGIAEQPVGGIPVACDAMGHARTVTLELDAPFLGSTVRDLSGQVLFLAAPDGLVELRGLPDGWTLQIRE